MDMVKASPVGKQVEFVDPYTLMLLIKQFKTQGQKSEIRSENRWNVASGAQITAHSAIVAGSDIRDIFGGTFGKSEFGTVLFEDRHREPFTHWVEWKTAMPMSLSSFRLYASGDGATRSQCRELKRFRLFGRRTLSDSWVLIDDFTPVHPYAYELGTGSMRLRSRTLAIPVIAQYFRAEFDQFDAPGQPGWGPRVIELEGYGK
jgi:hypothetical protein